VLALSLAAPGLAAAQAQGPEAVLPAAAVAQALALLGEAARALAPAGARVLALPGQPDPRLKLAPCAQVEAFLVPGAPAWGRTRVGLRCQKSDGPVPMPRWSITLPATVQVWAQAAVSPTALPVGATLQADGLELAEVDWAATPQPPFAHPAQLAGRVTTRSVPAGQALRAADLQARQWFAAGDTVRVVAGGPGFSISTEGQAVNAGIEGQRVRVRVGENRAVDGRAVGPRFVEGRAVGPRAVEVGP
jgi:flagella basal body P-ring formation protein FlgA